jgi:hypothetical protein
VLRTGVPVTIIVDGNELETTQVKEGVMSFPTERGRTYRVFGPKGQ